MGSFSSIEDLLLVPGIGIKTIEKIEDYIEL
jgi:DNA uptake protein ComE-like DNA-binding protein